MADKNIAVIKENTRILRLKLERLEQQQETLSAELGKKFTVEVFRQLNLVEYSIECTKNRLTGKFMLRRIDFGISISGPVPAKLK